MAQETAEERAAREAAEMLRKALKINADPEVKKEVVARTNQAVQDAKAGKRPA